MGHAPRLVEGLVLVGLVAIALGGCGTQSAPGDERPVATESASEKQLRRDVNAFDKVTLDFVSPSQETTRSDSTIHGQRLADVLTKAGIPSLPPDAEVYVAEVTTENFGEELHPDPAKPSKIRPSFDHDLAWVIRYHHVRQVLFGPPDADDEPEFYTDSVTFVKPTGFAYSATIPAAR